MDSIRIKRGLKAQLPRELPLGELAFCTDTRELYVGMGEGSALRPVTNTEITEHLAEWKSKYQEVSDQFKTKYDGLEEEYASELSNAKLNITTLNRNKLDYINVYAYKHLVVENDWTNAINSALENLEWGGTLYFPIGQYNHTGIIINKCCNFKGCGKTSSKLINIGCGDSIIISSNAERGTFEDIGIFGNWEQSATKTSCKRGFVFNNNSVCWNFNNIWMRGHGEEYFYAFAKGHVNNINISNSEFENGGSNCMLFYQLNYDNQINAIDIKNCNISNFLGNGLVIWGQAISVEKCTIQYCRKVGLLIDGFPEDIDNNILGISHAQALKIKGNYFELCYEGFIHINCGFNKVARYINGLSIIDNYGSYGVYPEDTDVPHIIPPTKTVSIVSINTTQYSLDLHMISGLHFRNSFSIGSGTHVAKNILEVKGIMDYSNVIYATYVGDDSSNQDLYICPLANIKNYNTSKSILTGNRCLSKKFDLTSNVEEVNHNDHIYWDIYPIQLYQLHDIAVSIETDCTDYTISPCLLVDNEPIYYNHFRNSSGAKTFSLKVSPDYISEYPCIQGIGFRVLFNSTKTNFKIKNPHIIYNN